MGTRLELHEALKSVIGSRSDGKSNVFFQPPESVKLVYPCIVYSMDEMSQSYADNIMYRYVKGYQITIIESDPDSDLLERLLRHFTLARFERSFIADNRYHRVVRLFY